MVGCLHGSVRGDQGGVWRPASLQAEWRAQLLVQVVTVPLPPLLSQAGEVVVGGGESRGGGWIPEGEGREEWGPAPCWRVAVLLLVGKWQSASTVTALLLSLSLHCYCHCHCTVTFTATALLLSLQLHCYYHCHCTVTITATTLLLSLPLHCYYYCHCTVTIIDTALLLSLPLHCYYH